jgi:hypothetical protein
LNNVANSDLLIGSSDCLAEADAFSSETFRFAPWEHRVSRGSVLIDLGQIAEGVILIGAALPKIRSPYTKAWCASYLALASARLGRPEECRRHLEEARKLDADCEAIEAVERKVQMMETGSR